MLHLAAIPWENAVFIIIFLVVGLFQWIAQEAAKRKKCERPPPPKPTQVATTPPREETDTDRIRRFLEALGQPTDAKPPPRAQPRPVPPPRTAIPRQRPLASPLPPLTTVPPNLPPPLFKPPPSAQVPKAPAITPAPPSAPAAPALPAVTGEVVRAATGVIAFPEPPLRPATGLQVIELLKSPGGLRDAIVLREIFGPPRSFQPFDLI